jgi:hypothetical protein
VVKRINLGKSVFIASFLGSSQFILFTSIAMKIYPGGSKLFPEAKGYNFLYNFFSDLGLSQTFSGDWNLPSRVLFTIALILVGISLLLYYLTAPKLFTSKKSHWFSTIASISGILAAVSFVAIAFTPEDLYPSLHQIFAYLAFNLAIISSFLFAGAIFFQKNYPNIFAWNSIVLIIPLTIILVLQTNSHLFAPYIKFTFQVLSQKIIVYLEILNFSIQAFGAWYVTRENEKQNILDELSVKKVLESKTN